MDGLYPYVFNNVVYNAFYFTLQFDVDSLPLSKCAGWMMGFRNPIYVANRDSQFVDIIADDFNTLYNYIKSESSYGSSSLQYFFLELDDFQRNCVPDKVISSTGSDYLGNRFKLPHMGWNNLQILDNLHPFLKNISNEDQFYFVHSYYLTKSIKQEVLANTIYSHDMPAIIGKKNFFGVQFHPEKSNLAGQKIISNWLSL